MKINKNYQNLKDSYLFSTIARKVNEYKAKNPNKNVIRLGIGDVTLPLTPVVITSMQNAVAEMGEADTFKGYGDEQGYAFLRKALCDYYDKKGVTLQDDEIFVSDGAKSDLGNILDIFAIDNTVVIPDPVYPVYVDTNIMAGRKIVHIDGNSDNNFLPLPDSNIKADIIYLCSPNNPTGTTFSLGELKIWVDYAESCEAVILYDCAYESFIRSGKPNSIYMVEGSKSCAIEIGTLSKLAGFTGVRCGYTIVPKDLIQDNVPLYDLWSRRQATKTNGVSYIVQRGAEAALSSEGLTHSIGNVNFYLENAKIISDALHDVDIWHTGGEDAPYIWLKCPGGMTSWAFFDKLLDVANVAGTPGAGYGSQGEGFFRLTAFASREDTFEAMQRIRNSFRFLF